jgi:bifunctional non-homologous end joining protein LigD
LTDVILDGEIVVAGRDGMPDFGAVRARLGMRASRAAAAAGARPAVFMAFDILWHEGRDLRALPMRERRRRLNPLPLAGQLALVEAFPGGAMEVMSFAQENNLEGITVKDADSAYQSGRSKAWLKFKLRRPEQVWVTAWRPGHSGEPDRYWVSRPDGPRLAPAGEVTFGLRRGEAAALRRLLAEAELDRPSRHGLRPVYPVVCMTVAGHGRPDGVLRDAVIKGFEVRPRQEIKRPSAWW